jgi:hypothetical protein
MATEEDTWATNIKKELQERPRNLNRDDLDQFEQQDKLLLRNNLIYVPKGPIRLKILRECHDNTLAGHFGMTRTHELVSRNYWWPKMNKLLREYVKSCDTCVRLVLICWRVVPHTISFYNPKPYKSQNILGHDIAKSIPTYPRPWYCKKYPNIS